MLNSRVQDRRILTITRSPYKERVETTWSNKPPKKHTNNTKTQYIYTIGKNIPMLTNFQKGK